LGNKYYKYPALPKNEYVGFTNLNKVLYTIPWDANFTYYFISNEIIEQLEFSGILHILTSIQGLNLIQQRDIVFAEFYSSNIRPLSNSDLIFLCFRIKFLF